ncbi:ROK family protein [Micromonospora sp. NPDC049175]|uniref:ROK family protein n=1 Tax=Micromonospora sp. NPDC049175 TaxID=3364266 RepID=UPI00372156F3
MRNAVALDIGGTGWSVATWTTSGVRLVGSGPTGAAPPGSLTDLRAAVRAACAAATSGPLSDVSIGISFPGGLDETGVVTAWPNRPAWVGRRLRDLTGAPTGVPVAVGDDGVGAVLGERMLGAARDVPEFLLVSLGTGIGGGVFLDGRVRPSASPDARTIGHLRALGSDRLCPCGRRGCLQSALDTLPDDEQLSRRGFTAWPDGQRLIDTVADLARVLSVPAVLLTGGRLHRPVLRQVLVSEARAAGLDAVVPDDPGGSALLGAFLTEEPLP